MVSFPEMVQRWKDHLRFNRTDLLGLLPAILVAAFVFSFRDWGIKTFSFVTGLNNLILMLIVVALSLFFRLACQKAYGLSEGYQVNFKAWWPGLFIMLFLAFVTAGKVPLIIVGGIVATFMVKLRLGEFRYGFDQFRNAYINMWGPLANLILALFFAIFLFFLPQSYVFQKGLTFNLIMAVCSMLPLPSVEGLSFFYGSPKFYGLFIFLVLLAMILLLSKTSWGLIIAIVVAVLITLGTTLTSYNK